MTSKFDYDVGILGGGSAGLTLASGAAQLGARTILIEKEGRLGGDCLHYGCVPSKTLIKTARVYHQMKNTAKFGLPKIDAPPVDFREVADRIARVISVIQRHDSEERFCSLGAKVEYGGSKFLDEHTVELDGRRISAKYWQISTGSSPAAPPFDGLDRTPYYTNKDLFYLNELPESLIVLGAGPIAIEMAQAFRRLGAEVTVIQRGGQILSNEDKDMADLLLRSLLDEGLKVHLNAKVKSVRDLGGSREVVFETNGVEKKLTARQILAATGRRANLDDLDLERAGVEYSARGLVLDDRLRTTQKNIFGAGDVTGRFLFTHAAGYEAGVVLANTIFRLPRKVDYTWLPWCTFTEPELASIGLNEKAAQAAGIAYQVWIEEFRANDRSLAEGEEIGLLKMLVDEKEKPIGVQILGPSAGDLLGEWVAVLNGKVKLSTLAGAVHPYPTLAEINKRTAGDLLARKLFSAKVRKGLEFVFHLRGRACNIEPAGK